MSGTLADALPPYWRCHDCGRADRPLDTDEARTVLYAAAESPDVHEAIGWLEATLQTHVRTKVGDRCTCPWRASR